MMTIRSIRKLNNGDGFTLHYGKKIQYKTGWQVADYGFETTSPETAIQFVRMFGGNCGVWFEDGIYYIDHSFRVTTKHDAMLIAAETDQISIYGWRAGKLAYVKEYFGE